jgi:hypothetical protein
MSRGIPPLPSANLLWVWDSSDRHIRVELPLAIQRRTSRYNILQNWPHPLRKRQISLQLFQAYMLVKYN